jgi:8-oxo-dGTP pyrophosphatase MutT (NUDIX family)
MAKRKTALQFAALPYKVQDGVLSVMLITSRETRRWVIPKGWPEKDMLPHEVAAHEAFEEAGLKGRVETVPFATFEYLKRLANQKRKRCTVLVFPMLVEEELDSWPEMHQRKRQWMTPAEASEHVAETGLIEMLQRLAGEAGGKPPFVNA